MTDLRRAAEMAVDYIVEALARHDEAYERHPSTEHERQVIINDLEALRRALAQPEQDHIRDATKKVEWVGLTDEERKKLADVIRFNNIWYLEDMLRAAEETLREKNT